MDTSKEYIKMCDCPEIQLKEGEHAGVYSFYNYDSVPSIWFPRQDQIQEMMKDHFELGDIMEPFIFLATHILSELSEDNHYQKAKTPEQLWLAFYMFEKHGKVWDGEKWLKNL